MAVEQAKLGRVPPRHDDAQLRMAPANAPDFDVAEIAPPPPMAGESAPVALSPRELAAVSARRVAGTARKSFGSRPSSLIDPTWTLFAAIVSGALGMVALATLSRPGLLTAGLAVAALLLIAATPLFARLEDRLARGPRLRLLLMLVNVGLPMMLFGMAVTRWTRLAPHADWPAAVSVIAAVSVLAAILLHARLPVLISAQAGLWLGLALAAEEPMALLVIVVSAGAGMLLAKRQNDRERDARMRQRQLEQAQLRAQEILADYEQTGQGWFWETDRRGTITYLSDTVGQLVGRRTDELAGRPFIELFVLDGGSQERERTLNFHLSARSAFNDLAVRAATVEGEARWWSISGRPLYDHFNNFIGFRGSGSDLTERRRSEEHASRLAHYDSLTGLSNRFQMSLTLEKILAAQRLEHRCCAIFLLDLDRFKQVNDTLGHPAGDQLLKQVAKRLERTIDSKGRVGRLGGDEFKVILPGKLALDELGQLARRVIEDLSQPYSIDGHRVVIGASVGIALAPNDGTTAEELIRNADLALYAAKDGGRGRHHFYAADLHSDAEERRRLEQDLRDAVAQGALRLVYQPVVHTTTEKITGFEALLRWDHPTLGPQSPAKFIPIAEDAGLIASLGEWALRTACLDLASWPASVRVAVNVSPLQFANPSLPAIVTNALAAAQIDPARLELEITESVFLNDNEGTDAMFAALKRVGVRLALDDFGTGYSSLGYLRKAPFDKIKIDQSFVRGATIVGSRHGAIIASIVSLAEALGMETTAEGVETLDELDLVRMLGCSHVQGYIYSKPMSSEAATRQLRAGLSAIAHGPRAARASRRTMLRKVVLKHNDERYHGTIRNISATGAMIDGLWNVPPGTIFEIQLTDGQAVTATARWCQEDRMGVEFAKPLDLDENGRIAITPGLAGTTAPLRARSG